MTDLPRITLAFDRSGQLVQSNFTGDFGEERLAEDDPDPNCLINWTRGLKAVCLFLVRCRLREIEIGEDGGDWRDPILSGPRKTAAATLDDVVTAQRNLCYVAMFGLDAAGKSRFLHLIDRINPGAKGGRPVGFRLRPGRLGPGGISILIEEEEADKTALETLATELESEWGPNSENAEENATPDEIQKDATFEAGSEQRHSRRFALVAALLISASLLGAGMFGYRLKKSPEPPPPFHPSHKVVKDYFTHLKAKRFDEAWNLLSDHYRDRHPAWKGDPKRYADEFDDLVLLEGLGFTESKLASVNTGVYWANFKSVRTLHVIPSLEGIHGDTAAELSALGSRIDELKAELAPAGIAPEAIDRLNLFSLMGRDRSAYLRRELRIPLETFAQIYPETFSGEVGERHRIRLIRDTRGEWRIDEIRDMRTRFLDKVP